jgi:dTDP-4-dehydrorhamnose 3,5-epimerase-like enzyme
VDPRAPDLERSPLFARAEGLVCVLEAGEMCYIPPYWWHHIESLDVSFSVSHWWQKEPPPPGMVQGEREGGGRRVGEEEGEGEA